MKYKSIFSILVLFISFQLVSCNPQSTKSMNMTIDQPSGENRVIISAPIVEKTFVNKNSKAGEYTELFLSRSIQDYFIKFCEGNVTREEIEKHISKDDFLPSLKLEVEFKEGLWDKCPEDEYEVQSRSGEYVVIYKIIND